MPAPTTMILRPMVNEFALESTIGCAEGVVKWFEVRVLDEGTVSGCC